MQNEADNHTTSELDQTQIELNEALQQNADLYKKLRQLAIDYQKLVLIIADQAAALRAIGEGS